MRDAEHIDNLLTQDDKDTLYKLAYDKAFGFKGDRLCLADQQQLSEYIDILRICVKFGDNLTAVKMYLKEYRDAKSI